MVDPDRLTAARDREVDRVNRGVAGPLPGNFYTKVVGVSFAARYPQNLYRLEQAWLNAELVGEQLAAILIRRPDNDHDPNAVEVHVPALGEYAMIGHLTRPIAARIAPELDRDVPWQGQVVYVKVHSDHPDRPGLDIHLRRRTHG